MCRCSIYIMVSYQSKSEKASGVRGYETGKDFIKVYFQNNACYTYSYSSAGKKVVDKMKKLALQQLGLSTYISQHKPGYESYIMG